MNLDPTFSWGRALWLLSPELILLLASALILAIDAARPHQEEKRWRLSVVTLIGLAAALAATWTLRDCNTRVFAMLSCDLFALVVKALALIATALVALAAEPYLQTHQLPQGVFYALLLTAAMAICLLGAATNLIMIFVAFDFLSLNTYLLTGYFRSDRHSAEAGLKYFLYGAALSAVMLYGLSWFYGLTGSTDLAAVARGLLETESAARPLALPALIFVIAGLAFKVAVVPFHQWAPDAYEGAPTPVTAFLSAGPKIAGFALIVRLGATMLPPELGHLPLDWRSSLAALAALTMTVGNLTALWQQNIKRLLAYSSIAHAGYILIGVVAASPLGTTAVLLYLAAYALTNLGAFGVVIAVSNRIGSDDIQDYAGLNKRAPLLAAALIICLLSLGGIPPLAGFIGKVWLFLAAIESRLVWLAVVGVINSVISLAYYWKIMRAMYMLPAETETPLTTPPMLAWAVGIAALGVFIIGVYPSPFVTLFEAAAKTFWPL